MELDWLIVGGGIHGVHIAARLLGDGGVSPDRLRIVDPGERLLERWRTCTATTGMTHLRSPSVHHLDAHPWSLRQFAGKRRRREPGLFAHPYERPALSLFNAHCDRVVRSYALDDLHVHARATRCDVEPAGVRVGLSDETEVTARHLVLAIGVSEQPRWPSWAPRDDARVHHIFEPGFDAWPSAPETVAVVGGGISAGQVALRLVDEGHRVHLVSRHALREHQFDSDPGWLGPKRMTAFRRQADFDRRRAIITKARFAGSVPPRVKRSLGWAMGRDTLDWHETEVDGLRSEAEEIALTLSSGAVLRADRVLLATGFVGTRPGGAMVDQLVESASLPCAECGYPIVDSDLRWRDGIHVSGPLAELELGPTARNIHGARRAAERLVEVAKA